MSKSGEVQYVSTITNVIDMMQFMYSIRRMIFLIEF